MSAKKPPLLRFMIVCLIGAAQLWGLAKHPVTIDDLLAIKSVDWLELSQDGTRLIYE